MFENAKRSIATLLRPQETQVLPKSTLLDENSKCPPPGDERYEWFNLRFALSQLYIISYYLMLQDCEPGALLPDAHSKNMVYGMDRTELIIAINKLQTEIVSHPNLPTNVLGHPFLTKVYKLEGSYVN